MVGYETECGYLIKYNNDENVVITFSGNDAYLEIFSIIITLPKSRDHLTSSFAVFLIWRYFVTRQYCQVIYVVTMSKINIVVIFLTFR
jgi:ABC-type tungstate transport system permease subunit